MTTVIVIDPRLRDTTDGHLRAVTGFVDAAHASGRDVRILGHRDGASTTLDGVPIEKVFIDQGADPEHGDPRAMQARLRNLQRALRDQLAKPLGRGRAADILVLAQPTLAMINALAAWASGCARENLPRLVVWMTASPSEETLARGLGSTAPLVAAFDHLRSLFGDHATFLASSDDQVAQYHALHCGHFACLPTAALCQREAAPDDDALRARLLEVLAPLLADEAAPEVPATTTEPQLPGVDIVVTLHDYARFLRDCLASVARQSYPHWRCVVIDDGSSDIAFDALRALVQSFGPRFSLARHDHAEGQTQAVATGLSLGANTFVVMLDADDRLEPDALDQHIAWHLNSRVPVALTSGQMRVVDEHGRLLSGALDHVVNLRVIDRLHRLPASDAFRRPEAGFDPQPALFADRDRWSAGEWFWAPSSGMMFRRSLMELILPDDVRIGYAADTYFGFGAHAFGSSILIDAPVARYTRHGGNAYANTTLYGAATLAVRTAVGGGWAGVAPILRHQIERHRARFDDQINADVVAHVLTLLKTDAGGTGATQPLAFIVPPPPPFVPRVIRRLRHEGRRLRGLARRIGLA
ncbi:MAG: glycosyltransferase [Xanthobacteraceae bacterium]|nr:glycosyltransferase [Xanthobacteraceae bacterium]